MFGSYYLVIFSPERFGEILHSRKIVAHSFGQVEDWAFSNTPNGYYVSMIEKDYCYHAADIDMAGAVDIDLTTKNI